MDKKQVLEALAFARAKSKKRKFEQTFEFIINFKGIDFKKAENRIDLEVRLPHSNGKSSQG
ncbi:MAG: 50S ribosomal protein L1, partial [Candidatus Diapherotrites archaeon]